MTAEHGRGRGGRGAGLSADDIVRTALALLDEHGVEWLTMRRLAGALGVSPSALYWHFPNKESLYAAVMDVAAVELRWEPDPRASPRDRLAQHVRTLRAHWRRYPVVVALGSRVRPDASGAYSDAGMAMVAALGFDEVTARQHWRALVWLALGFFYVEQGIARSEHHEALDDGSGRYAVHLGPAPEVLDVDALFEGALTLALDGLEVAARR